MILAVGHAIQRYRLRINRLAEFPKEIKNMENQKPGVSRRQMLAVMGVSSIGSMGKRMVFGEGNNRSSYAMSRSVTIGAKPAPITIDTTQTAVIVIDMQNDFGSKGGMFDRAGIDISIIQRAVEPTAKVLAAARNANIKIIYLKMAFRADLSDLGTLDSVTRTRHLQRMHVGKTVTAPDGSESRILIRDTWNTEILSELKPHAGDIVLYKHRYSGFFQTHLDSILRKIAVKNLIFTGCTTSVCVDSTIRDATFRDYLPILLADCTAEPIGYGLARSNHEASLLTIEALFGWVSDSEEFVKGLGSA
jgi:ureidoacrylate peracid hydrolase